MSHDSVIQPKTYLDRSNKKRNFYFISYSHKDICNVYPLLNELYADNVNFWYDVELDPGDLWNERVSKIISSEQCIGAVVFLSINSLVSNAVRKETELMLSIKETREFRIIPVIIGYTNAQGLIAATMERSHQFYENDDASFFRKFTKPMWLLFEDAKDKLCQVAEKDNVKDGIISNPSKFEWPEDNHILICGKYPFDENGSERDVEWSMICSIRNQHFFVSKYCVDFVGVKDISRVLDVIRQTIIRTPFSDRIESVELINEVFLNNYTDVISPMLPTDYADKNRQQLLRLFWVLEGDGKKDGSYVLYNAQKLKIDESIIRDQINAGMRLVLVMNSSSDK